MYDRIIEIPANIDCISLREIVKLVVEQEFKLNYKIDTNSKQYKWKKEDFEKKVANELCFDLNSLSFYDDNGKIKETDRRPAVNYNFGWDSTLLIEDVKNLLYRRRYTLRLTEFEKRKLNDETVARKQETLNNYVCEKMTDSTAPIINENKFPWVPSAQKIYLRLRKEYPDLSKEQLAHKIHQEMCKRLKAGETIMAKRGGKKAPSPGTILRYALQSME